MWSSTAPAVTCNEAVPVLPLFVPVTVCAPATEAVQVAPVQDPFGVIEKVVDAVMSPSLPLTVCAPAAEAVQVAPVQDPFGAIEKVLDAVTSPSELFEASKP